MKQLAVLAYMAVACMVGACMVVIGVRTAVAQPPPPPYTTVPPPREEIMPPPRGERFIWEPGHWRWDGRQYVWIGGRYIARRPMHHHWVDGRWAWAPRENRWIWHPAHWE